LSSQTTSPAAGIGASSMTTPSEVPSTSPESGSGKVKRLVSARRCGDWIESFLAFTKDIPSPEILRKWSAISTVAGAMQRRVWVESANGVIYPNLYVLLVAPPGIGKSEAIRRTGDLWRKTENLHVAANSVTSSCFLDILARSTVKSTLPDGSFQLFHGLNVAASEFGVLCPAHDLEFLNTLNDIFDCPDDFSEERRHRAEDQQLAIKYPIMNILGGTQPGFLSELLPEQAWSMGFTSRLLMIYSATPVKVSLFGMGDREEKAKHKSEYESRRKPSNRTSLQSPESTVKLSSLPKPLPHSRPGSRPDFRPSQRTPGCNITTRGGSYTCSSSV
jgi:hypothetical protein